MSLRDQRNKQITVGQTIILLATVTAVSGGNSVVASVQGQPPGTDPIRVDPAAVLVQDADVFVHLPQPDASPSPGPVAPIPLTFQQRVELEKKDLDDKIGRLNDFILTNKAFPSLSEAEQERLKFQLDVMQNYSSILGVRIAHFGQPVVKEPIIPAPEDSTGQPVAKDPSGSEPPAHAPPAAEEHNS